VNFEPEGSGVRIELPQLSDDPMRQPAWVLKVSR